MNEQRRKPRLGDLLVQQGLITQDQLRIALIEQDQNKLPLGQQLVLLGFITEAMIRDIVAQTIGQESVDLTAVAADAEAMKLVPEDFARRHNLLPIALSRLSEICPFSGTRQRDHGRQQCAHSRH